MKWEMASRINNFAQRATKVKRRKPTHTELAYYEQSIRSFGEKHGLTFERALEILSMSLNSAANRSLADIIKPSQLIKNPTDYPRVHFELNSAFHWFAIELFSSSVAENLKIQELLFSNKHHIQTLKTNGQTDITTNEWLRNFLFDCNLYLTFDNMFNAGTSSTVHSPCDIPIYFNVGVPDALLFIANLICKEGFLLIDEYLIPIKSKRNYRKMLRGLRRYEQIIDYVSDRKMSGLPSLQILHPSALGISVMIQHAGIFFVLFHEYAHILLGRYASKRTLELLCDEIALRCVMSMNEPVNIIGAFIALYIMMSGNLLVAEDQSSHPNPLVRYNQFITIIEENQNTEFKEKLNSLDKLLDIPHRYYEEEVYTMITEECLRKRLKDFFNRYPTFKKFNLKTEFLERIVNAVVDSALSIPSPSDEHLVTIINKDGHPGQYVHINTKTASAIILGALSGLGWSSSPIQFGLIMVSMILFLKDGVMEQFGKEAGILFGIVSLNLTSKVEVETARREYNNILSDQDISLKDYEYALQELITMGVLAESGGMLTVREFVIEVNI